MPKPLSRAETGALLDSLRALSDRIAAGEMSAGPTTTAAVAGAVAALETVAGTGSEDILTDLLKADDR